MPRVWANAVLLEPEDKAKAAETAPDFFKKLRLLMFRLFIGRKVPLVLLGAGSGVPTRKVAKC